MSCIKIREIFHSSNPFLGFAPSSFIADNNFGLYNWSHFLLCLKIYVSASRKWTVGSSFLWGQSWAFLSDSQGGFHFKLAPFFTIRSSLTSKLIEFSSVVQWSSLVMILDWIFWNCLNWSKVLKRAQSNAKHNVRNCLKIIKNVFNIFRINFKVTENVQK